MKAELIDRMGTDLTVVNAARVSFDKESDWYEEPYTVYGNNGEYLGTNYKDQALAEKDQKLLNYLAKHNHWTPFSHVMITMRETVPIFVARQRFKHMVGFTYNEISRRYVSDEPSFYIPDSWRRAAENKKQGSSDELVDEKKLFVDFSGDPYDMADYKDVVDLCGRWYQNAIDNGVAPEQARMVLPQSMYTSYYVTGSLAAWARAYKLRVDPHAQKEIQDLAHQWGNIIENISELKYSWKALTSE